MISMTSWLPATILSLLCFGLWGLFSKLAILHIDAKSALVFQSLGVTLIGLIILALLQFKPEIHTKGVIYAMLAGAATAFGCLFFFVAADRGKVTTVVTMTALYPIITILLAYAILHEALNLKQGIGILLAMIAIYLIT